MYIAGVVIAIVFFAGGWKVGQHNNSFNQLSQRGGVGNDRNFGYGQMMGGNGAPRGGMMRGVGFSTGTIVASDDKSITITLKDGGSKIIYVSDTTSVLKSTAGKKADLLKGSTVMVNGTANQDGSIAAQSIQIRPEVPAPTAQ